MAIPAVLLKRLEVLERSFDLDGSNVIKVFAFHPEEDVPYWDPEPPKLGRRYTLKENLFY